MRPATQFHPTSIEVYLVLAVLVLVMSARVTSRIVKFVAESFILMLILRHFLGHHHHGKRVTNATFWEHGTESKRQYGHGGFMDNWEHKPIGHRMLWRWACWLSLSGLIYGLVTAYTVTSHAIEALIVYGLVCLGFVIEKKIRLRVHDRRITRPCARSIAPLLRLSPHAVRRMIHIKPENVRDEGEIGWFGPMPDNLTPGEDQQSTIERIFDVHLPVDSEMKWKFEQSPRIGVILACQKPPDRVMWAEMLEEMAKCPKGTVVLGKDKAKEPFLASLTDQEDPHWGFDVNTKYGKSNFLGITTVQILGQDPQAQAIIIDPKRSSLIDFVGDRDDPNRPLLNGVTMANEPDDPEAMWAAIQKARAILTRRSEKYKKDRTRKFPCLLIILDELNQFHTLMKGMWNRMKLEDSKLPKDEREGLTGPWPGWDDIYDILQMGRFVNMHFLVCSQDFRDEVFGGRGGRNYLGFKGMAGFNPGQWDKFMQTKPVPLMQNHAGRWIFSDGNPGNDTWVQVVYADAEHDRAAYDYAARDRHLFTDNDGDDVTVSDAEQAALATDNERTGLSYYLSSISSKSVSQEDEVTDSRRVICGEREAAKFFGWKLTKFQSARRDRGNGGIPGEFKRGRTPCWYEEDLVAWAASRPRSRTSLRLVKDEDTQSPPREA